MRQPTRTALALSASLLATVTMAACSNGDDVTVEAMRHPDGPVETGSWAEESPTALPNETAPATIAPATSTAPTTSSAAPTSAATATQTVTSRPAPTSASASTPTVSTSPAGGTVKPAPSPSSSSGGNNFALNYPIEVGPHAAKTINDWRQKAGLPPVALELIPDKVKCDSKAVGSLYSPNQWASDAFVQSRTDLLGTTGVNAMKWDVLLSPEGVAGATLTLYHCKR